MPQASPIGGLSLIIHILINVALFLYRKLITAFNIPEKNAVSNYFEKLKSKDGETSGRKALSYTLVFFIFLVMVSNFAFVTIKLFNLDHNGRAITQITNNFRIIMAPNAKKIEDIKNGTFINAENQSIISENLESNEKISLVDFMDNIGIVDTSFEARASLAKELGTVQNKEEYVGSERQDGLIIKRIRDELSAYMQANEIDYIN